MTEVTKAARSKRADAGDDPPARRLSDKILSAFHQACDLRDVEVARRLLLILDTVSARPAPPGLAGRRLNVERTVAAHQRLWLLRHDKGDDVAA